MRTQMLLTIFLAFNLTCTTVSWAGPKSYQVTGPVLELTDAIIVVQKGDDKWEVARDGGGQPKKK